MTATAGGTHIRSARKTSRPGEPDGPRVELRDGMWHIRSLPVVRQVLREGNLAEQAGFNVDMVRTTQPDMRMPVLFLDGPPHRAQRSAIARYFAPATVSRRYRELMEGYADALVADLRATGRADLSDLTLRYSVEVAAQVIGLTNSDMAGMSRRLEAFFRVPPRPPGTSSRRAAADPTAPAGSCPAAPGTVDTATTSEAPQAPEAPGTAAKAGTAANAGLGRVIALADRVGQLAQRLGVPQSAVGKAGDAARGAAQLATVAARGLAHAATHPREIPGLVAAVPEKVSELAVSTRGLVPMTLFYVRDVRPAVAARRREPGEDVISHLLQQGYDDREILTECMTYAAAGMVTTREYISVATWHLLEDADLRARYLEADEKERYAILHEILRLEPVVGHLYRRTNSELVVQDGEQAHTIPAGAVLDLYIRAANTDPDHVGDDALRLCPGRELPSSVRAEVMAFGDGGHKCPGNYLAIQESDIFLRRLLRLPLRLEGPPSIGWVDLIAGYELRDVVVTVD